MAGSLQDRVKTWVSGEDVEYDDLNAEFDNVLYAMQPLLIDDYSYDATQMQVTVDPGEAGTESLATTLAGELARIRFILKEITGENYWYESPSSSLAGLENVVGSGLTSNRLVSGRVLSTSAQPAFLVPNGAARTIKLDGTPTSFLYYIDGTQYTISTDITLTPLTAAPSSNNTCLIDDAIASDQYWTKYMGEDGTSIPVDAMGTEITSLVGKFAAFKLDNGAATEYFTAYVKSSTSLTKARRGYFFDSTDAPKPRVVYSNNDTITLLKLTWVFATTDGTLTATYSNPVWSDDEPSSPATGDYWFDLGENTWKVYGVSSFSVANAILVGVCAQDTTNTIGARSFEFFDAYDQANTIELFAESNTQVKSRRPGQVNVWGTLIKNDQNLHTWDMTLDLESGVSETSSTYYYFYLTETGDKIISDKKPHDRREDLQGYYHPSNSWRCVGWAFNNSSSHLEQIESYFHAKEAEVIRSVLATDSILKRDGINKLSGASFVSYLPDAALCRGERYKFYHAGTSLTQIYSITAFGAQLVGLATTVKMHTNGQFLEIESDGANWLITRSVTNTAPIAYSPTLVGFGSYTNLVFRWARSGSFGKIIGSFTSGVSTNVEAQIPLPGGTYVATGATPLWQVGWLRRNDGGAVLDSAASILIENAANAYVVMTVNSSISTATGVNPLAKTADARTVLSNTEIGMVNFEVQMTDWLP
jgi:hypothetical protein